jgi:hypothetical protein
MSNESPTQSPFFYLQHALKDSIGGRKETPEPTVGYGVPYQGTTVNVSAQQLPQPSEADPSGMKASQPGAKLDAGKVDVLRGCILYFPAALAAVAQVSEFGARKYSWEGWRSVPDGINRYGAALARHLCHKPDAVDSGPGGTNLLHAAQVAWNALARLELIIKEQNDKR